MRVRRPSLEELEMLRSIADYQFGAPAGRILVGGDVLVGVSPSTRRIRELYGPEGLLAVLRAHDYFFSLTLHGAARLLKLPWPRLRVVVDGPLESKSLGCHRVLSLDTSRYAGEEVIVVDKSDRLLGVGRLRLAPVEIAEPGCVGEAVRLRKLVRERDTQ